MKKNFILSLFAMLLTALSLSAQTNTYSMVIEMQNGTKINIGPNEVKNINFINGELSFSGKTIEEIIQSAPDLQGYATLDAMNLAVANLKASLEKLLDGKASMSVYDDVNSVSKNLEQLSRDLTSVNTTLTSLQSLQAAQANQINTIEKRTEGKAEQAAVDELKVYVANMQNSLQSVELLQSTIGKAQEAIDAVKEDIEKVMANISNLVTKSDLPNAIADATSNYITKDQLQTAMTDMVTVEAMNAVTAALKTDLSAVKATTETVKADLEKALNDASNYVTKSDLPNAIADATSNYITKDQLQTAVANMATVETMNAATKELTANHLANKSEIDAIKTDLAKNSTYIEESRASFTKAIEADRAEIHAIQARLDKNILMLETVSNDQDAINNSFVKMNSDFAKANNEIASLWTEIQTLRKKVHILSGEPDTEEMVYYGFGDETLNNVSKLEYKRNQTSAIGTYSMQYGGSGRYLWIVLPASWTFTKFTMSGFHMPMESGQPIMVGSTSYTAYRSSNRYDEDAVIEIR